MFNNRFNESINEHMVETMKHAVEVRNENSGKFDGTNDFEKSITDPVPE